MAVMGEKALRVATVEMLVMLETVEKVGTCR
jgi:hypothetical protein